jgi:hypothetical protein
MKTNTNLFVLAGTTAAVLTGCVSTFKEVIPLGSGTPPMPKPTVLVLGDIKVTDTRLSEPEQKAMGDVFQVGVETWCANHNGFQVFRDDFATNGHPSALVLNGTVTEVEKGSAAERCWVGLGAGQQRVVGEFVINAADGTKLAAFSARKSYLGGLGTCGYDMMTLEELVGQLGELAAQRTDKWMRTGKVE